MKKILLFLCAALLSLVASAAEYDVLITSFNVDVNADNNIEFTSQLNGATLTEGDVVNLTLKGYFDAPAIVTYNTIADNAADACGEGTNCYWAQLAEWESVELGTAVIGEEFEVTKSVTITTTALTNEKYIVHLGFSFASLKDKKKYQQFKFRPTLEELNHVGNTYEVSLPTSTFTFDGNDAYKVEIPLEPESVLQAEDIVSLKINGAFSQDIDNLSFMIFDGNGSELLPWTSEYFSATNGETVNTTIEIVIPTNCTTEKAILVIFINGYDENVPTISFAKEGDVVHEPVELAIKDFTSLTLTANVWDAGSDYQYQEELTALEEGFQEGDYVTVTITGVASHNIEGLLVVLVDGSWYNVSDYTYLATGIKAGEEVSITKAIPLTSATETCRMVISTSDAIYDGLEAIVISPEKPSTKTVKLLYNEYGNGDMGTGEKSYSWQYSNQQIIIESVKEAIGDEYYAWMLQKGQQFALEVEGTCNATGTLNTGIVDEQSAAGWWFNNSEFGEPSIEVTAGQPFKASFLYTITALATENTDAPQDIPGLVFSFQMADYAAATEFNGAAPSEDVNGVKKVVFDFSNFKFTYLGNLEDSYIKPYALVNNNKKTGDKYNYEEEYVLAYDNAATTSDYFNFNLSGVATQDIDELQIALWDASSQALVSFHTNLCAEDNFSATTIATNISAGEPFSIKGSLPLLRNSNGEDNVYKVFLLAQSEYEGLQIILDLANADEFSIGADKGYGNPMGESGSKTYDVTISSANIDYKLDNDISITDQFGGALLKQGDIINLTIKGYFSVPVQDVLYAGIVDNSEEAEWWKPLSEMDYSGGFSMYGGSVNEGEEYEATVSIPIITDAISTERIIVRLMLQLSAKVQRNLGDNPVKLRPTYEELFSVPTQYEVTVPTSYFEPDVNGNNLKAEIDFETENALVRDDILSVTFNGKFSQDIDRLCFMIFGENGNELLPWTQKSVEVSQNETINTTFDFTIPKDFPSTEATIFVFIENYEAVPIIFVKDGDPVPNELAAIEKNSLTLNANEWDEGSNYQYEEELTAPADGFQAGDYVKLVINGYANHTINSLIVGLIDDSWNVVSSFYEIASNVKAGAAVKITKIIPLSSATETCRMVISTSDAIYDGLEAIVISPEKPSPKTVKLAYNLYGNEDIGTGEKSYTWQYSNQAIINEAVKNALEEEAQNWVFGKGQQFALEIEGTCNATGTLKTGIVDEQPDAFYWFSNSDFADPEIAVTAGQHFKATLLYSINALASEGFYVGERFYQTKTDKPGLVLSFEFADYAAATEFNGEAPSEDPFGVKKIEFNFTNFKLTYLGEPQVTINTATIDDVTITEGDALPTIDLKNYFFTDEDVQISYSAESQDYSVIYPIVRGDRLDFVQYGTGAAIITVTAKYNKSVKSQSFSITVNPKQDEPIKVCDLVVSSDVTNVSCYGENDGKIEVSVSGGVAPYQYKWSTGRTSNGIYGVPAGEYIVLVSDSEGCFTSSTFRIETPSKIVVEEQKISNPSCGNNNGSISLAVSGGTAPYTPSWSSSNNDVLEGLELQDLQSGMYDVVITDNNGCKVQKSYALQEQDAPVVSLKSLNPSKCNDANGNCEIEVSGGVAPYTITWSDSASVWNENNRPAMFPGTYTVKVVDDNQCRSVFSVVIPSVTFKQPEIALVTVGTESGKNLIVWQKPETDVIDYYTIWREGDESGVFDSLGVVKYNETSIFVDEDADIMVQSWRYKISATDVCGNQSPMSKEHKTIHLQMNKGVSGEVNLIWDSYEGVEYTSYYIFRQETSSSEMDTLKKVSARLNRYTDKNPPADVKGYYVAILLHDTIDVNKPLKAESGPFSLAISNVAELETSSEEVDAITDITVNQAVVYADKKNIIVESSIPNDVTVFDLAGKIITHKQNIETTKIPIQTAGVYMVFVGDKAYKVVLK